jgi:hypothetical protein
MIGTARRTRKRLLALLALLALAFGLSACGGVSSSSATTSSAASTGANTTPATPKPRALTTVELAAERRQAGPAAPFVKAKADNSVPTFGTQAGASQRDQAEATLKAYLQARAKADWPAACRYLSASTRQGFEKLASSSSSSSSKSKAPGCAPILAALSKGADLSDPFSGHLLSLRVHGINAFALFYGPHHQQYIVPMNREGGQWRLTQTAAIAYPPGAPPTTSP